MLSAADANEENSPCVTFFVTGLCVSQQVKCDGLTCHLHISFASSVFS